ncbi:hypothetical protein KY342_04250 [Candidatus Woesearchaeota archaeon]|nr:hypothetical protein [Candidatus Woesearchaeota archaeon]
MQTETGMFSPEDVFEAFLFEQIQRKKTQENMNTREVHRAFYEAQQEFPDFMSEYEFLLRTEPYSPTLHAMFHEYRRAGILTAEDGKFILRDPELWNPRPLKEPPEELKPVARYICDKV